MIDYRGKLEARLQALSEEPGFDKSVYYDFMFKISLLHELHELNSNLYEIKKKIK